MSAERYGGGTDPRETKRLLDHLCRLGFTDDAFQLVHHGRESGRHETIKGFGAYCLRTGAFRVGGPNERVHRRLLAVLIEHEKDGGRSFSMLAESAYP